MRATAYGRKLIATRKAADELADIVAVQREHGTPENDIEDGMRLSVAMRLARPNPRQHSPEDISDFEKFVDDNRALIDPVVAAAMRRPE